MGCGVSKPETDEGGGGEEGGYFKIMTPRSIGKDSENADSLVSDQDMSTHSKKSKTGGESSSKEEENVCKDEDERKIAPASPSFRIYCVFPRDPNDDNLVDDPQRISDESKEQRGKRQEAVRMKIRRRFNNVKKLLIPSAQPSSTAS
ncbi:unnamed protein product [Microthlaspi erraticum]|uniref:Uncharacterized protein n=1 Tax=Microthlaspi erraticum TaxID=1685480 RepID=A0A6D2KEG1_9BRAS|nr:unnamed protein product [Microthlaspi erraticum]